MGNVQINRKFKGLTKFQRKKLRYDFNTYFDLNKDGYLTYQDFLWAKSRICDMSGWKLDSPKYKITEDLFNEVWNSLKDVADSNCDGKISKTEWIQLWQTYKLELLRQEKKNKDFLSRFYKRSKRLHEGVDPDSDCHLSNEIEAKPVFLEEEDLSFEIESDEEIPENLLNNLHLSKDVEESQNMSQTTQCDVLSKFAKGSLQMESFTTILPQWLYKYLVFRFNLLDRTGDNVIDHEEFEYVLSVFDVSEKLSRQAFTIFTKNNTIPLDFDYFVKLFEEYYLSDDPSDLGNFINGRLSYDDDDDSFDDNEDNYNDDSSNLESSVDNDDDDDDNDNEKHTKYASFTSDIKTQPHKFDVDQEAIKIHEHLRQQADKAKKYCRDITIGCCVLI